MELTIKVELGLSQQFEEILKKFTAFTLPAPAQEKTVTNLVKQMAGIETAEKPKKAEAVEETKAVEPATEVQEVGGSQLGEAPDNSASPVEKASYTEQDIRDAMHRCRVRIEGEDYKVNTDSEGYSKYHKNLTQMFKNMSATLGYDKPSALPAELRHSFIAMCDDIIIGDNGELTQKLPF